MPTTLRMTLASLLVVVMTLVGSTAGTAAGATPHRSADSGGIADVLPDPVVIPIEVSGPASERLNIILLGDGYQADQAPLFRDDVERQIPWEEEPFRTYRNYINVYAVQVASIDYGLRCDPEGEVRHSGRSTRGNGSFEGPLDSKNTAFRMTTDGCDDPNARVLTIGDAPANCAASADRYSDPSHACESGTAARDRILDTWVAPALGIAESAPNVLAVVVSNTETSAVGRGSDAVVPAGSSQGPSILLQEMGRTLGALGEESPFLSPRTVRECYTGSEPNDVNLTIMSAEALVQSRQKWWRWVGEESLTGGVIGAYDGGGTYPCGLKRPSSSSTMRSIGGEFDQVGREQMVARIAGLRDAGAMSVTSTPVGTAALDSVLWIEAGHPRFHDLEITWRTGGSEGPVLQAGTDRSLDLGRYDVPVGTRVFVEVRDPVGPSGLDWVRNPSAGADVDNSGYNGPRFVQTRQWTVGPESVVASSPAAAITNSTPVSRTVARDEIVFVETNHHTDRVPLVVWRLNGQVSSGALTTFDLLPYGLTYGAIELTVTVSDPIDASTIATRSWWVDASAPTTDAYTSAPLGVVPSDEAHRIFFNGWDLRLAPVDMDEEHGLNGASYPEFSLNGTGWLRYYGLPTSGADQPPFPLRHSGTDLHGRSYGSLGTGGPGMATFERELPDDHPMGGFIPGFGTHRVNYRTIDSAGNVGPISSLRGTALPGDLPDCTGAVRGPVSAPVLTSGVTCLIGATITGSVTVETGASVVILDSTVSGDVVAEDAARVQLISSEITGATRLSGTTTDVTLVGNTFRTGVTLTDNTQVSVNERYSRLSGEYGPILAGNTILGGLRCSDNSAAIADFGARNALSGTRSGDCADLDTTVASAPTFVDVPEGKRFYEDIRWMADNGISTGSVVGDSRRFDPGASVSRQAFAAFLYRLEHNGATAPRCATAPYSDVPATATFCGEITWLKKQNITQGFPGNKFMPGAPIERQAMAAFLFRYANPGATASACRTAPFADVPVTTRFCAEIAWLKNEGITTGAEGRFDRVGDLQRQAAAAFLHRMVAG